MNKIEPLISIIVPVYGVENYLERCMETLKNQTLQNIEIILVDDESPDKCPEMCEKYRKSDSRVKVIHKKNGGLGFARNSGLELAKGEYVAFVDSDDYVAYDMCEKLYNSAKKYDADIVYGGIFYRSDSGIKESRIFDSDTIWKGEKKVRQFLLDMIATEPGKTKDTVMEVSVWKAVFKRDIFETNHIRFVSEREFISEDVIFDIDYIARCQCVVAIPEPVYYYCVNPGSLSKSFRTDRFQKVKQLYFEINRKLGLIYDENEYMQRTDRFLIARARTNARAIVHHKKLTGRKEMNSALKEIYTDKELTEILHRYPIQKLPKKHRIVAFLMKKRWLTPLELTLNF